MPGGSDLLPTAADVAEFTENGIWIGPQVLDDVALEACRAAMDAVYAGRTDTGRAVYSASWKQGDDPAALRKTDNAWWASGVLTSLVTSPLLGACAAALLETDAVTLWQDQLLYKPGGGAESGVVGWHQDWFYWRGAADAPRMLTAWVAFDDVDEANGAMRAIPGSNRWGLREEASDFFATSDGEQLERLRRLPDFRAPLSLNLRAGQASFHHALTFHGSAPNRTSAPRRALAVHLMAADVRCARGDNPAGLHYNVELFTAAGGRVGEPYSGELWPRVHPAG